jgi:hypothetical protein
MAERTTALARTLNLLKEEDREEYSKRQKAVPAKGRARISFSYVSIPATAFILSLLGSYYGSHPELIMPQNLKKETSISRNIQILPVLEDSACSGDVYSQEQNIDYTKAYNNLQISFGYVINQSGKSFAEIEEISSRIWTVASLPDGCFARAKMVNQGKDPAKPRIVVSYANLQKEMTSEDFIIAAQQILTADQLVRQLEAGRSPLAQK